MIDRKVSQQGLMCSILAWPSFAGWDRSGSHSDHILQAVAHQQLQGGWPEQDLHIFRVSLSSCIFRTSSERPPAPVSHLCMAHVCAAQPWEDAEISTFISKGVHSALFTCRTCLLGPDTNTTTLCVYAYFIAGVSILATIIVSIFLVSCAVTAALCMARHGSTQRTCGS